VFDQGWAKEMIALLLEAKDSVETSKSAGCHRLEETTLHSIRVRYGMLIQRDGRPTLLRRSANATASRPTAANLLKRLDRDRADVLRFATDFRAPFDKTRPSAT